jgi:nucleotide-binding universal stress UspA family protein
MKQEQEEVFEEFAREFIRHHRAAPPPWPIERILVATDFSLCSLNALEHAEALAEKLKTEVILLHVEPEISRAAEQQLARATDQLRSHGLKARKVLRVGVPEEEILNAVEAERASLVVMGTHGRKGIPHMLLGSVAEHVARSAPCPVLTVGPRKSVEPAGFRA